MFCGGNKDEVFVVRLPQGTDLLRAAGRALRLVLFLLRSLKTCNVKMM